MDVKALQEDLESISFTQGLAKPEMGNEVERRRTGFGEDRPKLAKVTRRRGREASERRSRLGEDEGSR